MSLRALVKAIVFVAALSPLDFAQPSFAAASKKRPVAKRAAPAPKPNPVKVLSYHLAINSLQPGESLASACGRADFKNLAIALNMNANILHQEKGEFETTAQFEERVGRLANAVNGGDLIFCQPLSDNEDLPFTYNADAQRFDGSFDTSQNVWRDRKNLGSYRSKTRMGIAATVKASAEFEYNALLTMPADDLSCGRQNSYASSYKFQVPILAAEAPRVKNSGYAVFIGKLVSPYVSVEERSGNPTLDDPYDEYEHDLTVSFRPERVVIVDGVGKELWSCRPGWPSPNSSPVPKVNPGSWVSNDDYPSSAIRAGEQGTVGFSLDVGSDGRVTRCTVTSSSGSAALDETTCRLMTSRARFRPATDSKMNPISGTWASSSRWTLQS